MQNHNNDPNHDEIYEYLIDRVPQIIWLADRQGELVKMNAVWQRYTGQPTAEALGQQWLAHIHSDDRSAFTIAWQAARTQIQPLHERVRLRMQDGVYEWFLVEANLIATLWVGTVKRLSSAAGDTDLMEGQEFLEALLEHISDGLVACNAQGQLVVFNRAAQGFHGLPPEPIPSDDWAQHYDLYDASGQTFDPQQVPLRRAFQGENVRDTEMMIIPRQGTARSLIANADPIYDVTGKKLGAVVLMRDMTALKTAETELRRLNLELEARVAQRTADLAASIAELNLNKQQLELEEARFRGTFEQAAIGCAHVALDGHWLRVNQKLCSIVGYSREELLQLTFQDMTHPDDLEEDLEYVRQLMAGEIQNYTLEKRYIHQNGSFVWVQITISLMRQSTTIDASFAPSSSPSLSESHDNFLGEPLYFIGMVEDISDRKQLEFQNAENLAALEQIKADLEKRNYELDQFVYIASHDLKAPLRGIANLSAWLEEDLEGQLPEQNAEQLNLMRQRVRRMERLIDGLLKYSRVGREQVFPESVNTYEMLLEIVDSLAPPAGILVQIPETMPTIVTKRLFLGQIFANLISNSIKHHDRSTGRIILDWTEFETHYHFSVTDDGPGIPQIHHDRIFGVFQTLHGGESPDSTGIGLALIKKMIEGEGGKIWIQTQLNTEATPEINPETGPKSPSDVYHENHRGVTFAFTWPKVLN